jgi:hypothetical protein
MLAPLQLSLNVGRLNVTFRPHVPAVMFVVTLGGHVMTGSSASLTVTVKLQNAALPAASCPTYTSLCTPTANELPLPAALVPVVFGDPQLSLSTGVVYVTVFAHCCAAASTAMLPGHDAYCGASRSSTVTVNEHDATLPAVSLAKYVTVFTPRLNVLPEAPPDTSVTTGVPQLSVAVAAAYVTAAVHTPASVP